MRATCICAAVVVLGISLTGCAVYEVASTAVDATTTVVGGAADIAGDVVTAPFGHDSDKSKD